MVPQKETTPHPVRQRRKSLRLTQAELAEAVAVSRQTIVAVEQGSYAPSVFLALGLGRVLDSSVEELFGSDPAVPAPRTGSTAPPPAAPTSPQYEQEAGQ